MPRSTGCSDAVLGIKYIFRYALECLARLEASGAYWLIGLQPTASDASSYEISTKEDIT
jgi:hypothetical protein